MVSNEADVIRHSIYNAGFAVDLDGSSEFDESSDTDSYDPADTLGEDAGNQSQIGSRGDDIETESAAGLDEQSDSNTESADERTAAGDRYPNPSSSLPAQSLGASVASEVDAPYVTDTESNDPVDTLEGNAGSQPQTGSKRKRPPSQSSPLAGTTTRTEPLRGSTKTSVLEGQNAFSNFNIPLSSKQGSESVQVTIYWAGYSNLLDYMEFSRTKRVGCGILLASSSEVILRAAGRGEDGLLPEREQNGLQKSLFEALDNVCQSWYFGRFDKLKDRFSAMAVTAQETDGWIGRMKALSKEMASLDAALHVSTNHTDTATSQDPAEGDSQTPSGRSVSSRGGPETSEVLELLKKLWGFCDRGIGQLEHLGEDRPLQTKQRTCLAARS